LDAAEFALPGARQRFNGHAWLDSWTDDPWTHGSYSAYAPGMMTRYFGFVGEPTQGVHFAGEHTSMYAQGYMEGAVESGERAADEIAERGG
jgi:monoamine oxidase